MFSQSPPSLCALTGSVPVAHRTFLEVANNLARRMVQRQVVGFVEENYRRGSREPVCDDTLTQFHRMLVDFSTLIRIGYAVLLVNHRSSRGGIPHTWIRAVEIRLLLSRPPGVCIGLHSHFFASRAPLPIFQGNTPTTPYPTPSRIASTTTAYISYPGGGNWHAEDCAASTLLYGHQFSRHNPAYSSYSDDDQEWYGRNGALADDCILWPHAPNVPITAENILSASEGADSAQFPVEFPQQRLTYYWAFVLQKQQ